MKKLDRNVFADKASKLKENIKGSRVKFPLGKNSKKKEEDEKAVFQEEADKAELQEDKESLSDFQENSRYTEEFSGNIYRSEPARRSLYETGTISQSRYQRGAVQNNLYQTGMLSENAYSREVSGRNVYQTGVMPGNAYSREASGRNVYQTGVMPGSVYSREASGRNVYQTGVMPGNVYSREASGRNLYQTGVLTGNAYGAGTVQNPGRAGSAQRKRRQSGGGREEMRSTKAGQGNRSRTKAPRENAAQRTSGSGSREAVSSRRNVRRSVENERAAQSSKFSGAIAAYIKIALVGVLLLFIMFDLSDEPDSAVLLETVAQNVVEAAGLESAEPAEARMIKRFYGLNPKDYDGAVLYAPADNMDAHELFLVKLKDDTQKRAVEDAIEERLDTQLKSFEGYGAEQTALLESHVLSVKGNYMLYIVGEYAEDARKAFAESL